MRKLLLLLFPVLLCGQQPVIGNGAVITLAAGNTIQGVSASATTITYTITGVTGLLAQGQLPSTVGVLYTAPAGASTYVTGIMLVNTSGSSVGGNAVYINGTTTGNSLLGTFSIPANGTAELLPGAGWRIQDASGNIGTNTGGGGGANANGYYLVNQSTNAPTNAINLGALTTGLPYETVSGGVATFTTATAANVVGVIGATAVTNATNATTATNSTQLAGATPPTSANVTGTNGSGQLVSATGVNIASAIGSTAITNATNATTSTTQTLNNNSTAIATTAYVDAEAGLVGAASISTTGGSTTLSASQYGNPTILVTGALTSNATLVVPNNGQWLIANRTTGPWSVTVKTSGGTGQAITQGYSNAIAADGTNVIDASNDYAGVGAYTNSIAGALDPFYAAIRQSLTKVVRIISFGDSIITCYQISPCGYGPFTASNSPIIALRNELNKQFPAYSTGMRPLFRLVSSNVVDGGEGGYTLTSGTVAQSTLIGPQETGVSLNGSSLGQFSSGAVLTVAVGQAWSKVIVYCATNATSTGWTPTIGGVAQANICTAQPGSATPNAVTVTNPTSIATQGSTPSTLTFTALGANSFLGGYEAVVTNNSFGLVVDNLGVGGISGPYFVGTHGQDWVNIFAGQIGLCILETGENDANAGSGPQTPSQVTTNLQTIATNCQAHGAGVLMWVPPPYSIGAAYNAIQLGELQYAQTAGWDILNMGDVFYGYSWSQGYPNFTAQNTAATQALNCTYGLLNCSDNQHPSDLGSWKLFNQLYSHLVPRVQVPIYGYAPVLTPNSTTLSGAYTNATTGFTNVCETAACLHTMGFPIANTQTLHMRCHLIYQVSATTDGIILTVTGPGTPSVLAQSFDWNTTLTAHSNSAITTATYGTQIPTTGVTTGTATTNFTAEYVVSVTNSTTAGTLQLQAKGVGTGTLTIQPGTYCVIE